MNTYHAILIITIVAICTFFTRLLPFLLFGGNKEIPTKMQYLGKFLPASVMAILVIYCLKDISFVTPGRFLPQLLAVILVVVLHLYKRNNLLSIGAGTLFYMFLIQFIFK